MDRKIELDRLSDADFQCMLLTVNAEVLKIAKEAQDKINELLGRFDVKCDLSLSYQITDPNLKFISKLPETAEADAEAEIPAKKKRTRKKKT